jgi:DNA adenine methylase
MKSVLKYPGSKWRIAGQIVSYIPEHHSYVEPFFGSGAVLFNKLPSPIETVNDLDWDVCNLFHCIQNDSQRLASLVAMTPYSRSEYDDTFKLNLDEMEPFHKAARFLVQCWQGHGFRVNGYKVGWKNDVQGRENMYEVYNWYRLPEWIIGIVDRLKQVQIENRPATEVIKRFWYPNVFMYLDPPYTLGTRTGRQYKHEMTDEDHIDLLKLILQFPGKVIISGYENDLYDRYLDEWHKESIKGYAQYHGADRKEVLWMNYTPIEQQLTLLVY